jgi:hypothetical protein
MSRFNDFAPERALMLKHFGARDALADGFSRWPIDMARVAAARSIELKRRIAAGEPCALPRSFGTDQGNVPFTPPQSRPATAPPTAARKKPPMTDTNFNARLDAVERKLAASIRSKGGTVPKYTPSRTEARDTATVHAAAVEAEELRLIDQHMSLTHGATVRRDRASATVSFSAVSYEARRAAPSHAAPSSPAISAADRRAIDQAMGSYMPRSPTVRREGSAHAPHALIISVGNNVD